MPIKVLLLLDLFTLNLAALYLYLKPAPPIPSPICQSICPIPTNPPQIPTLVPTASISPPSFTQNPKKASQVTYIPIPGSGSQLSYDWYTIPGTDFYFDTNDFPGLKAIYFEANIRLLNGNGTAFVRLFDTTHNFIVQNSQIQTNNQTSTVVVSQSLTFRSGQSLVKVQLKSLTADTAIFDSGRLKLVSDY